MIQSDLVTALLIHQESSNARGRISSIDSSTNAITIFVTHGDQFDASGIIQFTTPEYVLEDSTFNQCEFFGVDFTNLDIDGIELNHCSMSNNGLYENKLKPKDLKFLKVNGDLKLQNVELSTEFSESRIDGTFSIYGAKFMDQDFSHRDSLSATFLKCHFRRCNFAGVRFEEGSVIGTIFEDCIFDNGNEICEFDRTKISGSLFTSMTQYELIYVQDNTVIPQYDQIGVYIVDPFGQSYFALMNLGSYNQYFKV